MSKLLEPKVVEIKIDKFDKEGKQLTKTYTISKFPAIAGRSIVAQYLASAIPKLGEYQTNEAMMFRIMGYVAVAQPNGDLQCLSTQGLIDNNVDCWETGLRIEWAMIEYNCSFFRDGRIWKLLQDFVPNLMPLISQISTRSSAQSSEPEKPPTPN
jgi:hypothetical protein